jgi:drug/metabolite transporter (DMT)-like permease
MAFASPAPAVVRPWSSSGTAARTCRRRSVLLRHCAPRATLNDGGGAAAAAPAPGPVPPSPSPSPAPPRILGVAVGPQNARLLLALVTFTWGSFPVLVKFMYAPTFSWALKPFAFNAARLVLGAATCAPFVLRMRPALRNPAIAAGTELGILTLLVNMAQLAALAYTSAGRLSFIAQLQTLIVPLAMFVWSRVRRDSTLSRNSLPARVVLGASATAVAGTLLLTLDKPGAGAAAMAAAPALWKGDALSLISAVCAAVYIIRSRVHSVRLPAAALAGIKVMSQALFAVVQVAGIAAYRHVRLSAASAAQAPGVSAAALSLNALCIFYGGAVVCGLSTVMQISAQAHVSASEAAVIFAFIPVWTSVVASLFLRERMGPLGIAGALLIFASSVVCAVAGGRRSSSAKSA